MKRRLAAILAADVVGYARLVRADETGTLTAVSRDLREVFQPAVTGYGGRIVKTMGDGLLAELPSAVDAVRAAVIVQVTLGRRQRDVPEPRSIRYRIGITIGDIVVDGADIQGDGVNLAARLEALAEPGGVLTTRAVAEQLRGRLDLTLESLAAATVKNIAEPIELCRIVLDERAERLASAAPAAPSPTRRRLGAFAAPLVLAATLAGGLAWWRPWPGAAPTQPGPVVENADPRPSIAVLPFANLSDDPDQDWLVDGMTEDVITDLAQISGLVVIARNSTFAYKGQTIPPQQIARDLKVRTLLAGSVRRAGDLVRVNVQLVDGASGTQLWAERFDETMPRVLDLQDRIARRVVAALSVELHERDEQRLAVAETADPGAYEAFKRGWEQYRRQTPDSFAAARLQLERAVRLDPGYGRALAALALLYHEAFERGWSRSALHLDYATARLRAGRYLQLAKARPTALAHRVASLIYLRAGRHDVALAEAAQALVLDAGDAENHAAMARALVFLGRADEAVERIRTAMRLEVNRPAEYPYLLGLAEFGEEHFEAAAESLQDALSAAPASFRASAVLAAAWAQLGRAAEARSAFADYASGLPQSSVTLHQPMSELTLRRHWPYAESRDLDRLARSLSLASGLPFEPVGPHAEP